MPGSAADPMAEIKYWFKATAAGVALAVAVLAALKYANIPDGNTATIMTVVFIWVGHNALSLRKASEDKRERDAEARKRDEQDREDRRAREAEARKRDEQDRARQLELQRVADLLETENRARAAEIAQVARKTEEVKAALSASDRQRDAQVGQLQGTVNTMHGTVDKIEDLVDGEHGVALRALADATAQLAGRPGATPEQKAAAIKAGESSRKHDERLAIQDIKARAEEGRPAAQPLPGEAGPTHVIVDNTDDIAAAVVEKEGGPPRPPST